MEGRKEQEAGEYWIMWNLRFILYTYKSDQANRSWARLYRILGDWTKDTLVGFLLDFGFSLVVSFHLP